MISFPVRLHRSIDPRPLPPVDTLAAATRALFEHSFRDSILVQLPFMAALTAYRKGPRAYAQWRCITAVSIKQGRMSTSAHVGPDRDEDDYDSYMEE